MDKKSAEQILNTPDFKTADVEVPSWGCSVKVRSLSVKGRVAIGMGSMQDGKVDQGLFLALTVVHGCMEPRFNEDQVQKLLDKDFAALDSLAAKIWDISRPGAEEVKNG
jgi:hypothetical protein